MNRKAPWYLVLLVAATIAFSISCTCAKSSDSWAVEGKLNGVMYNMGTGFFDVTVDCDDGYRVVFTTTKDVAYWLMDHKTEPLDVHCRWYKCRQWRWIPEVSVSQVVATQPKCKPCWSRTERWGV